MKESNSDYYNNSAISGGAIKCDSCKITISDTNFKNNKASDGGVFLFDNEAILEAKNIKL